MTDAADTGRKLSDSVVIDRAGLMIVRLPLVSPFETSFGMTRVKEAILARIESDGVESYGECVAEPSPYYSYEYNRQAWDVMHSYLLPSLKGVELHAPADFISVTKRVRGHNMAKACIEMAIWDLFARRAGRPLSKVIGGRRTRIECGISIGIQKTPDALLGVISNSLDAGYRRIKIKIRPGWDTGVLGKVRKSFPDIPLQVDANAAYTTSDFTKLRKLDRFGLQMIEQPLDYDDLYGHSLLQRKLSTPICLDESIKGPESVRLMSKLGSGRIVNIKAGRVGGLSASLEVHDIAMKSKIPVWIGGMLETGIGRAFNVALNTLPNVRFPGDTSPSSRYFTRDIITHPFEMNGSGLMEVPKGHGTGVEVDARELEKRVVKRKSIDMA